MGVDATLMVLHRHGLDDRGAFVAHVLSLQRERDLWEHFRGMEGGRDLPMLQLPHGSWSGFSDGHEPTHPEGMEERGYLMTDCYDEGFRRFPVTSLPGPEASNSSLNRSILSFVHFNFSDHEVVVFWW